MKAQTVLGTAEGNGSGSQAVRLMGDKRQKNQSGLAFAGGIEGEARKSFPEGTESPAAKRSAESPAMGEQWMARSGYRD